MNVRPLLGSLFSLANLVADTLVEDLRAASGDGPEAAFFQEDKRFAQRHFEDPVGKVPDLHRGERLDDQVRIQSPEVAEQIQIPLSGKCRMKPADHMDFRDPQPQGTPDGLDNLGTRHLEGVLLALLRPERAELAGKQADVRVVNVAVVDERGDITVDPLPHHVGKLPDPVEIPAGIEDQCVLIGNSRAGTDLVRYRTEFGGQKSDIHVS